MDCRPNLVITPSQSHAPHVPFSKIFVWGSRRQLVPFFGQSPFRTFRQTFQGGYVVDTFVEMFEMEIVQKKGTGCRRLVWGVSTLENETACLACRDALRWFVVQIKYSHHREVHRKDTPTVVEWPGTSTMIGGVDAPLGRLGRLGLFSTTVSNRLCYQPTKRAIAGLRPTRNPPRQSPGKPHWVSVERGHLCEIVHHVGGESSPKRLGCRHCRVGTVYQVADRHVNRNSRPQSHFQRPPALHVLHDRTESGCVERKPQQVDDHRHDG